MASSAARTRGTLALIAGFIVLGGLAFYWANRGPSAPHELPELAPLLSDYAERYADTQSSAEELLDTVQPRLERRLDLEGAAMGLERVLAVQPEHLGALMMLVEVSMASGGAYGPSTEDAALIAAAGERYFPADPQVRLALAAVELGQGEAEAASARLTGLTGVRAQRLRAESALATGQLEIAEAGADALAQRWPDDSGACAIRARVAQLQGDPARAQAVLNACTAAGALDPSLPYLSGKLLDEGGRPVQAMVAYAAAGADLAAAILVYQEGMGDEPNLEAMRRLRGRGGRTALHRGWIALAMGDPTAALAELDGVEGVELARVAALLAAEREAEALALIDALDPDQARVALLRARVTRTHEDWGRAVELAPDNPAVWRALLVGADEPELYLGALVELDPYIATLTLGESDRDAPWMLLAPESWEEALERCPATHRERVTLWAGQFADVESADPLVQATALSARGQGEAARTLLERDKQPMDPRWRVAYASALLTLDRPDEAMASLGAAETTTERVVQALGSAGQGQYAASVQVLDRVAAQHPDWVRLNWLKYNIAEDALSKGGGELDTPDAGL